MVNLSRDIHIKSFDRLQHPPHPLFPTFNWNELPPFLNIVTPGVTTLVERVAYSNVINRPYLLNGERGGLSSRPVQKKRV